MLFTTRYVLPGGYALGGLACLIVVSGDKAFEGWALFTGAGLSVLLFNVLIRIGEDGDRDLQAEDAARAYFDAHGRWPDE